MLIGNIILTSKIFILGDPEFRGFLEKKNYKVIIQKVCFTKQCKWDWNVSYIVPLHSTSVKLSKRHKIALKTIFYFNLLHFLKLFFSLNNFVLTGTNYIAVRKKILVVDDLFPKNDLTPLYGTWFSGTFRFSGTLFF